MNTSVSGKVRHIARCTRPEPTCPVIWDNAAGLIPQPGLIERWNREQVVHRSVTPTLGARPPAGGTARTIGLAGIER